MSMACVRFPMLIFPAASVVAVNVATFGVFAILLFNGSCSVQRVRSADVVVADLRIDQGRVDLRVAQEALHLFNRHSVAEQDGCDRVPEHVRSDPDGE